jgi:hypothetical protein
LVAPNLDLVQGYFASQQWLVVQSPSTSGRVLGLRLLDIRPDPTDSGISSGKKIFRGPVPESRFSSRGTYAGSVSPRSADGSGGAELRLAVLWSLPTGHQTYLFEEVRKLCSGYLRRNRISAEDVTPLELVSEVWKKLLSSVSLETDRPLTVQASEWSTNLAPERDGRVIWLVAEIGGSEAIGHRYEDIQRERHGRSKAGTGRPYQQRDEDEPEETGVEPNEPGMLEESDRRRIWRGLLATAAIDFSPDDDVSVVLELLAGDPDILSESPVGQWPVRLIVARLNDRPTSRRWSEDHVDNAKRRLMNWIVRLRNRNRLDGTDLEALFAKVARQLERGEWKPPSPKIRPPRVN